MRTNTEIASVTVGVVTAVCAGFVAGMIWRGDIDVLVPVLDFIASIVGSIAWPFLAMYAVYTFADPLKSTLDKIRKFKYGDMEFNLARELDETKEQAGQAGIDPVPSPAPENNDIHAGSYIEAASAVAARSPEAAILSAWVAVELAMNDAVARVFGDAPRQRPDFFEQLRRLKAENLVDPSTVRTIQRMRGMRNSVAHPDLTEQSQPTPAEAADYLALANGLVVKLNSIRPPQD